MKHPFLFRTMALALLTAGLARCAEAGLNRWTSGGPGGVPLAAYFVLADPSSPGTLYARTNGAVLRSRDGGRSWTSIHDGVSQFPVTALALDPSTSRLYAGVGPIPFLAGTSTIFSFVNERWSSAIEPRMFLAFDIFTIVFDPNPLHATAPLYVVTDNGISKLGKSGFPRVINAGLTNTRVRALAMDPTNPVILYAGTMGGGVFKTINGGEAWSAASSGLTNADVSVLAIDASDPLTVYAGTNGGGIFKSTNGAATWRAINTGLTGSNAAFVHALSVDPSAKETIYAGTDGGVFKSGDGGATWAAPNAGLPDTRVYSLALDPVTPTTLYAGTEAGIFKSTDGGRVWDTALTGTTNSSIQTLAVDPFAPATLYAGTLVDGVFKSTNGGASWRPINNGLAARSVSAFAVDPGTRGTLYAGGPAGIFKSADGGESWNAVSAGLADRTIRALAAAPSARALFVATDGGIFRSTDGAATWTTVSTDVKDTVNALAVDVSDSGTLYAATSQGVVKLRQAGDGTWTAGDAGLKGVIVTRVIVDPSAPATLYAGGYAGPWVFKSSDGGQNWSLVTNGLGAGFIRALTVDPATKTIYAGLFDDNYAGGVFKSLNGGESWTRLDTGLTDRAVIVLAVDPSGSGTLYAGTFGGGVFDYESVSPESACQPDPTTLCVNDGRFQVRVEWAVPYQGASGEGRAGSVTGDTGYFWFFSPDNIELAVKVVDGRSFNDRFWVFSGALSDVEYTIAITDTVTGAVKTYFNPAGRLASVADTDAFGPSGQHAVAGIGSLSGAGGNRSGNESAARLLPTEAPRRAADACALGPSALCLHGGRFQVQVHWRVPSQGENGDGLAVPLTSDAGYFWFFSGNNVELVIKVVDGRAVNGRFWFFSGALSNVEYAVTVTDTATGAVKTYFNPSGRLASVADTAAF